MATKRAVYPIAEFKAVGDKTSGEFKAIVSVFNNVDHQGDRVMPGAFAKSLAQWKTSGDPIPVIFSHQWDNPDAHIGVVSSAQELDGGLVIVGKNDLSNPFAAQVHKLLVERRMKEWSFAYEVNDESPAKDGANNLNELSLIEVGPTLKGANPDTATIAAKAMEASDARAQADGTKAGRRLSQATQTEMQSIHDDLTALQERMRALMGTASEEPKSADTDGGADTDVDAEDREPPAKSDRDNDEKQSDEDREPPAKSTDDDLLLIKTRIEQVRAETRRSP